tara:strand:+ start:424 stop:789 length:366 start_codon:yes stop_codon:yes gene_type:complete
MWHASLFESWKSQIKPQWSDATAERISQIVKELFEMPGFLAHLLRAVRVDRAAVRPGDMERVMEKCANWVMNMQQQGVLIVIRGVLEVDERIYAKFKERAIDALEDAGVAVDRENGARVGR